jgi:hypothetical protein
LEVAQPPEQRKTTTTSTGIAQDFFIFPPPRATFKQPGVSHFEVSIS